MDEPQRPPADFAEFFSRAVAQPDGQPPAEPYSYQRRFAEGEGFFEVVRAPTGAGKTATVIVGWLWRRQTGKPGTPRRLIYCLPMRVLVEQTVCEARKWIENLALRIPVYSVMGGHEVAPWYLSPEEPAILIGTQDMLLSRALNRGYAAGRFHWPIDFGLLNNDALWIFDEPHLMAAGLTTSAQLAGLRRALGTFADCPSVWMSATLEPSWLDTVDHRDRRDGSILELDAADLDHHRPLHRRMHAKKTLHRLNESPKDAKAVAKAAVSHHQAGTQTLVIVNTVERARGVYAALEAATHKGAPPDLLLVHSRFRPAERDALNQRLTEKDAGGRIIVATQVVEAGVDISARTLITELAPWASLVQRMGRCNRTGADGPGMVYWLDLDERLAAPYSADELAAGRATLESLEGRGVAPRELEEFQTQHGITLRFDHRHVLRRRDMLDLFDTAPDLSGNDIDVQRFIRGDDPDVDVHVFWRHLPDAAPTPEEPAAARAEMCAVPIGQVRRFLEASKQGAYSWDPLARLLPFSRGDGRFCYEKGSGLVGIMGCRQTIQTVRARKLPCAVYQKRFGRSRRDSPRRLRVPRGHDLSCCCVRRFSRWGDAP